jgi:hypothetical protein
MFRLCGIGALVLAVLACGDKVEVVEDPSARGAEGESCTSRSDCEDGLACIDNRCVEPGADSGEADGGDTMPVADTRGSAGESCTRRADCMSGHACVDSVCLDEGDLPMGMIPSTRGARGESCQARNDCVDELACIGGRCIENDFSFDVQPKECFRVQCEEDDECCSSFVAPIDCPTLQTACEGGDAASCTLFDAQCVCPFRCTEQSCIVANACEVDTDCFSAALRCFDGVCAQCVMSSDCPVEGEQCMSGVCRAGCERNDQCPLFFACQEGECIETGCQSARECYFATQDPLSECRDGTCVTPCENDAECGAFEACSNRSCMFIGCETDEECRILLGVQSVPGSDRAVCREP